jgi:hypothetical protein
LFAISWLHFVVLVFASFRLTRLIIYDDITSALRELFVSITFDRDESGHVIGNVDQKGSGWRRGIGML